MLTDIRRDGYHKVGVFSEVEGEHVERAVRVFAMRNHACLWSRELDTKFHQIYRGPSIGAPPKSKN